MVVLLCLPACQFVFPVDPAPDAPIDGIEDAAPDTTQVTCPIDYVASGSGFHRAVADAANWSSAETLCESDQTTAGSTGFTHLVVISDAVEYDLLRGLLPDASLSIGMSDQRAEGAFGWITAEPTTFALDIQTPPWPPGEPNDFMGVEDCVVITPNGALNDVSCLTISQPYICECDANTPIPLP